MQKKPMTRRLFFGTASAAMLPAVMSGEDDAPPLEEAGVLTLRKGDVLVIHLREGTTMADYEEARAMVREALGWEDVLISQGVERMEVVRRSA